MRVEQETIQPDMTMKTKSRRWPAAAILLLIVSLASVSGQPAPKPVPAGNPATGQPPLIDPTTGLPLPQPEPQWIDQNWHDPGITLTNVMYDNLPLDEVARDLRARFKDNIDILPMPTAFGNNWGENISIRLQMKNVTATDVFNAMNLVFENDRTPLRWHLMNPSGTRCLVQLCVLPQAAPAPQTPAPEVRRVFFVGDCLGEKPTGMTMKQIVETVSEIWQKAYGQSGKIQFYEPAQLIIVTGTQEQIDFINQTVGALRDKANLVRDRAGSAGASPKIGPAASGGAAVSK